MPLSNPIIISDLIKTGRFDEHLKKHVAAGKTDEEIAWLVTDELVKEAQSVFLPVWEQTKGNDGYVSFELDPMLEDVANKMPHVDKVKRYIELAKFWGTDRKNRMIKVPATAAGLDVS